MSISAMLLEIIAVGVVCYFIGKVVGKCAFMAFNGMISAFTR